MDKLKDWDEFAIGSVLFPFKKGVDGAMELYKQERTYSGDSSFSDSVAHWRVEKPVHNSDICINCFTCWVFCPDAAILLCVILRFFRLFSRPFFEGFFIVFVIIKHKQ